VLATAGEVIVALCSTANAPREMSKWVMNCPADNKQARQKDPS
jgi:hypothetical protein